MTDSPVSRRGVGGESASLAYWGYQAAGWCAYSAIGIVINLLNGSSPVGPLLVGHAVLVVSSIGLTHGFRGAIRRRRSDGRSFGDMRAFLTSGVVLISLVQTAVVIGVNVALTRTGWPMTAALALFWGMLLATGVWTLLYVRFSERRGHAQREAQLQLALSDAQLHALEAQVNPHFLFNCLNSIRALVMLDPARAQEMLTRLANVLRSRLSRARHTVPLASELAVVSDYLALEAVRFEERLRTEVIAGPDTAQCAVPPLVVHTLVENAITHGIARLAGPGILKVRGERQDGMARAELRRLLDAHPHIQIAGEAADGAEALRLIGGSG